MPKPQDKSIKLRKAHSQRTLREDGIWMYHDSVEPSDVLKTPSYFDEVATDLIDPEKYFTQPLTSGIGTRFCLLLGDPMKVHHKADFEVDGLVKKVNENGIATYRLLWSVCGDWKRVDIAERTIASMTPAPEEKPAPAEKKTEAKEDGKKAA